MYCVVVTFKVALEAFDRFVERVARQASDSLSAEPECRVFDVWTSAAQPGQVFLYEIYDDRAAFDAHLASPHFKAFDAEVAPMVLEKSVVLFDRRVERDR